jgi:hypothetical protein
VVTIPAKVLPFLEHVYPKSSPVETIEYRINLQIRDEASHPRDVNEAVPFDEEAIEELIHALRRDMYRRIEDYRGYIIHSHGPYKE